VKLGEEKGGRTGWQKREKRIRKKRDDYINCKEGERLSPKTQADLKMINRLGGKEKG